MTKLHCVVLLFLVVGISAIGITQAEEPQAQYVPKFKSIVTSGDGLAKRSEEIALARFGSVSKNIVRETGLLHHVTPRQPFSIGTTKRSNPLFENDCDVPPSIELLNAFFAAYPGLGVSDVSSKLRFYIAEKDIQLGVGFCIF